MNTQTLKTENELTLNLMRKLALMQHLGEEYFIIEDDRDFFAYEGNEEEARANFEAEIEGTDDPATDGNFRVYCDNNLTQVEELEEDDYSIDYMVLTDEEADKKAAEYIKDSVWAFNASFLASQTDIDIEVFEAIQNNNRCESNNKAILSMIGDIDGFIEDAISADGRGHFMSSYDGEENEETVNGTTFYIYRTN